MTVSLEGMKFHSPIGFYEEEQVVGNEIMIDLEVELNLAVQTNDQLTRTINYETLYEMCKKVALKPFRLIETYCTEIINMIILQLRVNRIKIKVSKLNPALGGSIEKASVTMERVF
ncbi:hypothetical protein LBMAG27_21920 [Bacteroidota bacterium]|nr:hypothetical protein LBMAG27_21920 [Bacteroidota bacterium]